MPAYICVTHALSRREETDSFCRTLARYGFRFACIHEQSDPQHRGDTLKEASLLIALTCPAAVAAETVASDIRRTLERGRPVLCVSMGENELDDRFCAAEGSAALIPAPITDSPDRFTVDRQSTALFVHRLFVRHLARHEACFSAIRCVEDAYGRTVAAAVAAHKGDADACFALGRAYERGEGVPKLEVEAAHWISLAAEQGVADARIRMGELYLYGRETERDPEAAFCLFTEASRKGDLRGEYHRGLCYLRGMGVMRDPQRAFECFDIAARGGYAPALYELGLLYRDGIGVKKNRLLAIRKLKEACEREAEGDGDRQIPLPSVDPRRGKKGRLITMRQFRRSYPLLIAKGRAGKPVADGHEADVPAFCFARNRITASHLPEDGWVKKMLGEERIVGKADFLGAEGYSPALAAVALGHLYATGQNIRRGRPHSTRALAWYRYAADLGSLEALYELGDAYRRGYGAPSSFKRAFLLFELAAAHGDDRSSFALGVCYEKGIGTAQDPYRAYLCYEKAALSGYAPAQNNLGGCYERGMGVEQDIRAAAEWYARAATREPAAACRLGICYEEGRGVEKNRKEAFRQYTFAADNGNAYAKYRLALIADQGENRTVSPSEEGEASPDTHGMRDLSLENAGAPQYILAARLLKEAAEGGVAEAAYLLALYHTLGRGVRRDSESCYAYLDMAAQNGSIPACYAMGMAYLDGRYLVRNSQRAVECFESAVALWRKSGDREIRGSRPFGTLAEAGLTNAEAAGGALYMLGYCTLYGIREKGASEKELRASRAAAYFEEASHADHVGALTALGDLYAYRLLQSPLSSPEDESLRYYMEAARVGAARKYVSEASTDSPIDALMSLAARSTKIAEAAAAEGDEGAAELARVRAWRSLARCSELGSPDAWIGMAACAYHGYGTPKNITSALWFLDKAHRTEGGRVTASLWLGDLYYAGVDREPSPLQADEAYLRAISIPEAVSECGNYTLSERRQARRMADHTDRAEACYRLAVLRAIHFADGDKREAFSYLVKAILMGHKSAREDLARMYAFESSYIEATAPKEEKTDKVPGKKSWTPAGAYARRRILRKASEADDLRDGRSGRSHGTWMTDYYTALWPTPRLFSHGMTATSAPADRPAYVSAEVTPAMLAAALNYLGDCLFFGNGLTADPTAAVACYREVVDMNIRVGRGEKPPKGLSWAQYSYGWCLLRGTGIPEDARRGVEYLLLAAKYHGEACYLLGECYEAGIGVDVPDDVEAFKYYRKARKLGCEAAEVKIRELEKKLRAEL